MKFARIILYGFMIAAVGCAESDVKQPAVTKSDANVNESFEFNNATFAAPIMLMAGGEPMEAGYSYPSPAVFDVDNDGQNEMVLGEIMGTLSVCENENKSTGDPEWSSVKPLLGADGEPIQVNNW